MASGKLSWKEEHVAYFREIVPGHSQGEIAEMFEDRFGIRLSVSQVKNAKMRFGVRSGTVGGQFKPGQKAWNKGMPLSEWMSPEAERRCVAGRFKPGNLPHNSAVYGIGDERVNADGYTEVKIMDRPTDGHHNNWKPKHLIVWEREHGRKVPQLHRLGAELQALAGRLGQQREEEGAEGWPSGRTLRIGLSGLRLSTTPRRSVTRGASVPTARRWTATARS